MRPRRAKLHRVEYTFYDRRLPTSRTEYWTVNGTFTLESPFVTTTFPDGQVVTYDPMAGVEIRYAGYMQPGKLTLRERFADAWDAFRGRELPK